MSQAREQASQRKSVLDAAEIAGLRRQASQRQDAFGALGRLTGTGADGEGGWDRGLFKQGAKRGAGRSFAPSSGGGPENEERIGKALSPRPSSFAAVGYWPPAGSDAPRESRSPFRTVFGGTREDGT